MTDTPRVTERERREALAIARFVEESQGADEVPQWDMEDWDRPIPLASVALSPRDGRGEHPETLF